MLAKNGVPTERLPLPSERKSHLQTVRITTAESKPDTLDLNEGRWWTSNTHEPQLAVSDEAGRDFGLKIGDQVQFQVAGRVLNAPLVAVFRRTARAPVRYDLVFPRGALQNFPVVYYGAVHVDPANIPQLEETLFERFPTVTVMNLADVLKRIQEAVDEVALVVRFLALFAILAGVIILSSSVAGTRYRRIREVAILKTLGATKRRISAIFSIEFSILGAVSGLVGAVLANVFTRIVSERFIEASPAFDWASLVVVMLATAVLAN
jgi:putative ABC transport system permease protein